MIPRYKNFKNTTCEKIYDSVNQMTLWTWDCPNDAYKEPLFTVLPQKKKQKQNILTSSCWKLIPLMQEKQSFNKGVEYTSSWFTRTSLSFKVLTVLFYSMHSMFVETAQVVLEEHTIQCCETSVWNFTVHFVWNYILGSWHPKVHVTGKT